MQSVRIQELLPHIDANFRTLPHRDSRGIAGDFIGGYGAIRFGMKHPDVFGCLCAASGGDRIRHSSHVFTANWDVLANAKSLDDAKKDGFTRIFTTIFQAHFPNPDRRPVFIDLQAHKAGEKLVIDSTVTERLRNNFFLESTRTSFQSKDCSFR